MKKVLIQRLEMENMLCVGISRLVLFSLIFILLVQCNDVGVPASVRLGVSVMLQNALGIAEFEEIRTLEDFRDFLADSSERLNKFSVSSNSRLPDPDSIQLVRERVQFVQPVPLLRVSPAVTGPAFSFSAWVEPLSPGNKRLSILRQPLQARNDLSCWGWFYPEQLRFGAHDFHLTNGSQLEEVVEGASRREGAAGTALVHVVMVMDSGIVSFYRNGKLVGEPQRLPRPVTGCLGGGSVELGDTGVALAAAEFRPRALASGEVDEIFRGGQPLAEIATGTGLDRITDDPFEQVQITVQDGAKLMRESVEELDREASTRAVITNAKSEVPPPVDDDPQFPLDEAPAAALLLGEDGARHLTERERLAWEAGGRPQQWPESKWVGAPGTADAYWEVVGAPVYADTWSRVSVLPPLEDPGADGMTISFWFKNMFPSSNGGPCLTVMRGNEEAGLVSWMAAEWVDVWAFTDFDDDGLYTGEYLSFRNPSTQRLDERFALAAFAEEPGPAIWRFMVLQYDAMVGSVRFFLDGKRVFDSAQGTNYLRTETTFDVPRSVAEVFGNASVLLHDDEETPVIGKFAQLRFHPRLLSEERIAEMHEEALWPSGGQVKACVDESSDFSYYDSIQSDDSGLDCAWYNEVSSKTPKVCSSPSAKRRCPFSCRGVRACHDGRLDRSFVAPAPQRTFRIFDRIMHLRPKVGQPSLICPSSVVPVEEILAECQRFAAIEGFYDSIEGRRNFSDTFEYTWFDAQRADVRDCEELRARLDADQCSWDGSWLSDFEQDWREQGEWSVRFWARATANSKGMPGNFYPTVHLFSSLAPALVLVDWFEANPVLEAWMMVQAPLGKYSEDAASPTYPEAFVEIYPTSDIKYAEGWTMFHAQLRKLDSGGHEFCATLNAMPLACLKFGDSGPLFDPSSFIQAIELTTEMLITPIEVSTQTYSPSQVQEIYYDKMVHMRTVEGPSQAEADRQAELRVARVNVVRPFRQQIALVAPPVLFQTRRTPKDCKAPVTAPFFEAQYQLMLAAHCATVSCQLKLSDVMRCTGDSEPESFFGLQSSQLGLETGFADFLSSLVNSPVLVRQGQTLRTEEFLDTATRKATAIAVFHMPDEGLTSVLELRGEFEGADLVTSMHLTHLDYMPHERRSDVFWLYGTLLLLLVLVTLLNLDHLVVLWRESKARHLPIDRNGMLGVLYDLGQVVINLVFAVLALTNTLGSEGRAEEILQGIASVPFADSSVGFSQKVEQFFTAINALNQELVKNDSISLFAFVIMLLMLLRILHATAVHPRMGVLVGTLRHGMNDLWHFCLLFLVVFVFFSYTATWLFGFSRSEFSDLRQSMKTQFDMLLGQLPVNFIDDSRMVTYVVLSMCVQFFLMLNFLLAIVVEGYMRVREDIANNESEREFTQDVALTVYAWFKGKIQRWPSKREVVHRLRHSVASAKITRTHISLQGFPLAGSWKMFDHYQAMEEIGTAAPEWVRRKTKYEIIAEVLKRSNSVEQSVAGLLESVRSNQVSGNGHAHPDAHSEARTSPVQRRPSRNSEISVQPPLASIQLMRAPERDPGPHSAGEAGTVQQWRPSDREAGRGVPATEGRVHSALGFDAKQDGAAGLASAGNGDGSVDISALRSAESAIHSPPFPASPEEGTVRPADEHAPEPTGSAAGALGAAAADSFHPALNLRFGVA